MITASDHKQLGTVGINEQNAWAERKFSAANESRELGQRGATRGSAEQ